MINLLVSSLTRIGEITPFLTASQVETIADYAVTTTFTKLGYELNPSLNELPPHIKQEIEEIFSKKVRELNKQNAVELDKEIIIEELTKEEATVRVIEYLRSKDTAYISELQENLHIDLELLVDILQELIEEGRITAPSA